MMQSENSIDLKWADEHIAGFKKMREDILEVKADERRIFALYKPTAEMSDARQRQTF